jgi:cupin fold WbuC family metalloprotein
MDYWKENDEVLYPRERFVDLSADVLAFLKSEALKNPRKRIRLCTHQGKDDKVHEMFIVHTRDTYVRPHKHIRKAESLFIMEGEVDAIFFDDSGKVVKKVEMGPISSGKCFYYRISEPIYHTLRINSDTLCFHEVAEGPFNPADTVFPSWAPDGSDEAAWKSFMERIKI